jgi:hypothetical protein
MLQAVGPAGECAWATRCLWILHTDCWPGISFIEPEYFLTFQKEISITTILEQVLGTESHSRRFLTNIGLKKTCEEKNLSLPRTILANCINNTTFQLTLREHCCYTSYYGWRTDHILHSGKCWIRMRLKKKLVLNSASNNKKMCIIY